MNKDEIGILTALMEFTLRQAEANSLIAKLLLGRTQILGQLLLLQNEVASRDDKAANETKLQLAELLRGFSDASGQQQLLDALARAESGHDQIAASVAWLKRTYEV